MIIKDPRQIKFFEEAFIYGRWLADGVSVAIENATYTKDSIAPEYDFVLRVNGKLVETFDPNDYYKPDPDWIELPDHTMKRIQ